MKLNDWIKENGYTQGDITRKTGWSRSRVSRICSGRPPTLEDVSVIYDMTKGKVTWRDFLSGDQT